MTVSETERTMVKGVASIDFNFIRETSQFSFQPPMKLKCEQQ